jgi:CRISPR-associated protein Csa3
MRTYLSAIGYKSAAVTRTLLGRGINPDDRVVLLRPTGSADSENEQSKSAVRDVEQLVEQASEEIPVEVEGVPYANFDEAILRCSDLIRAAEGEVLVNLGAGPRDVLVPLTIATLVHVDAVDTVVASSDIDGDVRSIPIPNLVSNLSDRYLDTLRAIESDEQTVGQIADRIGTSDSTTGRHVSALADIGAVSTRAEGTAKIVSLTLTGELIRRADRDRRVGTEKEVES